MKKISIFFSFTSLVAFLYFFVFPFQNENILKVGDQAPIFSLTNIDGKTVSLNDYNNQGAIVIFTCNHCPFSVMYEDRILELDKKFRPLGYPVIAINPNDPQVQPEDSFENMVIRAKEKNFTFPYLFDEKQTVYPAFGAQRTPHVFLLDNKHTVRYIGAIDDNARDASAVKEYYLESALKAIINNQNPQPNHTKAIGCSIKTQKH